MSDLEARIEAAWLYEESLRDDVERINMDAAVAE